MKSPKSRAVSSVFVFACALALGLPAVATGRGQKDGDEKQKPKFSLRANPQTGFSPLRVVVSAELRGGADDHPEFYCPTVEWVWGDDTRAESSVDCDPYQPGKSEIKRRYTTSRVFQVPGEYRVEVRLKQKDKIVSVAGTTVRVQRGVRDCCT